LSRSQKLVKVQYLNCGQMRVPGCKNHYKSVLSAGAKVEDPPTGGAEIPPWRGKNRPAFSIKKRETTYPYCPCHGQLIILMIFILVYLI